MRMTLLEMVRNILSALESDDVTSITDTAEAGQVAEVLKEVYFQMISNQTIPEHQALFKLTDAGSTKTFMLVPTNVVRMESFYYNKILTGQTDEQYGEVKYMDPVQFKDFVNRRLSSDTNVVAAVDPTSGLTLRVRNDAAPTYWTSFDDQYIVCDSYDAVVDASGLTAAKTQCWGTLNPTNWALSDTFIPDIDDNMFPYLLAESKSVCFVNLKQTANAKIDKQARQQRTAIQNDKYRTRAAQKKSTNSPGPNYGRKRR